MPNKSKVLLISSLAHAYSHACILSVPPLLLILKDEYALSMTEITFIITCSGLLFGIGALPFGALSDKIGPIKVNLLGVGMVSLAALGIYFSKNIFIFAFFLLMIGLGSSTYHPSAFKIISSFFKGNMGRAFGINGLIGNIGQIGAPITSAFIAYNYGWRPVFLSISALGVLCFLLLFLIRDSDGKICAIQHEKRPFAFTKEFILIMGVTMTAGLAYRGTITMLPAYSTLIFQKNTFQAGALVTIMLTTGGVSQLIAGEICDRFGSLSPLFIMAILSIISIGILPFSSYYLFIGGLMLFGFSYFAVNLYTNTLIADITPHNYRGTYYGITFLSRFGLGFLAPSIVGFISDIYSIKYLFYVILIFLLVFLIITGLLYSINIRCHGPKT